MGFSANCNRVLKYLQKHPDEYETAQEIGDKLDISMRAVTNAVNRYLKPQSIAYYQPLDKIDGRDGSAIKLTVKGKNYVIEEQE